MLDIEKSRPAPLTSDPAADSFPVWSPDGRRVAFRSERDRAGNLYEREVDVVGLKDDTSKFPTDWSRDYLAYHTADGDIWAPPLSGDSKSGPSKPVQVTTTPFIESDAKISPDGHWIAYVSNQPAQPDVYIQSFPDPAGFKQRVSTAGGVLPRWSPDGKELFYIARPNMMSVSIKPDGSKLKIGLPATLSSSLGPMFNVSRDGHFLLFTGFGGFGRGSGNRGSGGGNSDHIVVLFNWAAAPRAGK